MFSQPLIYFVTSFIHKKPTRVPSLYPLEYEMLIKETSFIDTIYINQRFWHVINQTENIPVCYSCKQNLAKWSKNTNSYSIACCKRCAACNPNRTVKQKLTNLQRYGVDSYTKTDEYRALASARIPNEQVIHKRKQTSLEKYGVDHYSKTEEAKANASANINLSLLREGFVRKYGDIQPMQLPSIKERQHQSMLAKYSSRSYHRIGRSQTFNSLLDKHWLEEQHHHLKLTQQQIATKLGVNPTTVGRALNSLNIEKKFFYGSAEERSVSNVLEQYGIYVQLHNRTILSGKELDIVMPDLKLAIEYCGMYWHSDIHPRITKHTHMQKMLDAKAAGYELITLFQYEWMEKRSIVLEKLLRKCMVKSVFQIIGARECNICDVSSLDKNNFLNTNHIQGSDKSNIAVGLKYRGELVAVMSGRLSDRVFNLNRFATKLYASCPGAFSKLLRTVETQYKPTSITTFADLRWGTGDIYTKTGFVASYTIPPTFYIYDNKSKLVHRSNYMKHKVLKAIPTADSTLTERELCDTLGLLRVWDCGKIKFVKLVEPLI